MNYKKTIQKLGTSLVMAIAFTFVASSSFAARVDLVAIESQWTPIGGTPITMWGFATDAGQPCVPPAGQSPYVWTVGPELTAPDDLVGSELRIRLRNCLSEPVSIIIPGQTAIVSTANPVQPAPVKRSGRIESFTRETPVGGTRNYFWRDVDVNEGTYLYMSGTHPAKQVHMGLYGALKIGNYPGAGADITLLYSEIDSALHDPVPTAATPLTYKPDHFLVNGTESVNIVAGDSSQTTAVSFLNAGLDFHVPTISGGEYMTLQAEDGNLYPFAKTQYSVDLPAGKTIEALWDPTSAGEYFIYDRRGNGMKATLTVADPAP